MCIDCMCLFVHRVPVTVFKIVLYCVLDRVGNDLMVVFLVVSSFAFSHLPVHAKLFTAKKGINYQEISVATMGVCIPTAISMVKHMNDIYAPHTAKPNTWQMSHIYACFQKSTKISWNTKFQCDLHRFLSLPATNRLIFMKTTKGQ